MTEILTNANIVTPEGVVYGTLLHEGGRVVEVAPGVSRLPSAEDAEGDFIAPGLIECHTDNLERHFVPRPGVIWPNAVAAALAHDAQMAAAGVTTVYDAVCAGGYDDEKDYRRKIMADLVEAVDGGMAAGIFRLDHKLHLRCELTDPIMMRFAEPYSDRAIVGLASLMDHTPGQRQWRDVANFRRFISGERAPAEIDRILEEAMARGTANSRANFPKAVALFRERGIPIASHDDTTEAHVAEAHEAGARISEFPTTLEAARAAHRCGMKTVGGAPNVVRGGSHSGGVAIRELAAEGVLDTLSSDYVPASLLQAVHALTEDPGLELHEAIGMVTWRVADMLRLSDRGELAPGRRADFVRYRIHDGTPLVRETRVLGRRVL